MISSGSWEFLSTPSARRATIVFVAFLLIQKNFYPRPPRGGRRSCCLLSIFPCCISIHALREEGDVQAGQGVQAKAKFLSTPSARRATKRLGDARPALSDFYPRPPRGGRRGNYHSKQQDNSFLSTPSARRATSGTVCGILGVQNFYPRPPRGGRQRTCQRGGQMKNFYPRPPRGGRPPNSTPSTLRTVFLSTPSARRATFCPFGSTSNSAFLSTPSARRATYYHSE